MPRNTFFSSGSKLKSFNANSRVVIRAMVTDLEITGGIISYIAISTAFATIYFKFRPSFIN